MASERFQLEQEQSYHNAWTNNQVNVESIALVDANAGLEDSIKFWIDADNQERQRIDSVAGPQSIEPFDHLDTAHTQVYGYAEHSYVTPSALTEMQPESMSVRRRVKSEPQLTPGHSWDIDYAQDDLSQRLACSECRKDFANLRALDKHTQKTSHKAWRCSEPECGKSYTRRDTYLRHRAAHKETSHPCFACLRDGKEKVFKRRDHLREHVRSCHSKSSEGVRHANRIGPKSSTSSGSNSDGMDLCNDNGASGTLQQQAMKDLVKSLSTVLGDRHPNLVGKLDVMTALSAPAMESVAESMAVSALAKTYFSEPERCKCSCTQQ